MDRVERAKQVDFVELLDKIQIPYIVESGHVKIICCFHEENTESLAIYPDNKYYCFACSASGDIIDFVKHVYKVEFGEAISMLNTI